MIVKSAFLVSKYMIVKSAFLVSKHMIVKSAKFFANVRFFCCYVPTENIEKTMIICTLGQKC